MFLPDQNTAVSKFFILHRADEYDGKIQAGDIRYLVKKVLIQFPIDKFAEWIVPIPEFWRELERKLHVLPQKLLYSQCM